MEDERAAGAGLPGAPDPAVVIIGELNVDFILGDCEGMPAPGREILAGHFQMVLGSSSAICAAGLARLGIPVQFVGLVGADMRGEYCIAALRDAGVDVSQVVRDPAVSTGVTVALGWRTDRALVTYPGSIVALTPAHLEGFRFEGIAHLHVSSYFLQAGLRAHWPVLFGRAAAAGWTTSLDPGCDPAERWDIDLGCVLRDVDVFLPNEVELAALTGRTDPLDALRCLDNGRTLTVVKQGARGATALDDGRALHAAPPPVDVVDTTGAGDSFDAGFLAAWLRRQPLTDALRAGVTCGALSTRGIGGTAAQPTRREADERMAGVRHDV